MNTKGKYFVGTVRALNLHSNEAKETTKNATSIVAAIIKAYGGSSNHGINPNKAPKRPVTGLVYGRIQSGKTRAMIASTALAFDNKFRIAVVMTSNINDLVSQTHMDFSNGLPGLMIFTKDTDLGREVGTAKLHMEKGNGCLLLVCSKGRSSLQNISNFLSKIGADQYPAIIFDDEGDQASLDTNTSKRSKSAIAVAPSAINSAIQDKLRPALPKHVYVSVTGTPQAVLLQSAESSHRPSFIQMLPPGKAYVGGDTFFSADEPEQNSKLIAIVDPNERQQLLKVKAAIPEGLQNSILFFLVASAAAIRNIGPGEKGYSYLCHPSLKNDEQSVAEKRINTFLEEVLNALYEGDDKGAILSGLHKQYVSLKRTLGSKTPPYEQIKRQIGESLPLRKILVINAKVKRQGIGYGNGLNFLIGGNTLGRGIAIRDLLVTYYIRTSQISQIDTMHQHARMYGYRKATLEYTRLFITRNLYYRFRDIYQSDEDLREYINRYKSDPSTFPIEYGFGLRPTRVGVLDAKKIDTLNPGKQLYPNYILLPQKPLAYKKILKMLGEVYRESSTDERRLSKAASAGVIINSDKAAAFVKLIKTHSRNTWRDQTIADAIKKVADKFGGKVLLRFRLAERTVQEGGFISTGTLSGDEARQGRDNKLPTLWIMSVTTKGGVSFKRGLKFMYPTLVIPKSLSALYMFNRG